MGCTRLNLCQKADRFDECWGQRGSHHCFCTLGWRLDSSGASAWAKCAHFAFVLDGIASCLIVLLGPGVCINRTLGKIGSQREPASCYFHGSAVYQRVGLMRLCSLVEEGRVAAVTASRDWEYQLYLLTGVGSVFQVYAEIHLLAAQKT